MSARGLDLLGITYKTNDKPNYNQLLHKAVDQNQYYKVTEVKSCVQIFPAQSMACLAVKNKEVLSALVKMKGLIRNQPFAVGVPGISCS